MVALVAGMWCWVDLWFYDVSPAIGVAPDLLLG
jgi:hypothetical protein